MSQLISGAHLARGSASWWTGSGSGGWSCSAGSCSAAGLVASAFANALWQVIVLDRVVMTLGANCLGLVVFVRILSRRFVRNRGMAVAIVQSANGFARAFSAPLSQMLIASFGGLETGDGRAVGKRNGAREGRR